MHFICYASSVIWPGKKGKGTNFIRLSDLSHAATEANNQTENIRVMIFIGSAENILPEKGPLLYGF